MTESAMDGIGIKDKLEAYRRKKRRERMTESIKNTIQSILPWNENKTAEATPVSAPSNNLEVGLCSL